jgi:hypothetical protein
MDRKTYNETLRLVGKIAVQYKLPAGDPCWISKEICSYIDSPLRDTIKEYRVLFRMQQKLVREWNSYINYKKYPSTNPVYKQRINLIDNEIHNFQPELIRLYKIISSYHTVDNRIEIDRQCYE